MLGNHPLSVPCTTVREAQMTILAYLQLLLNGVLTHQGMARGLDKVVRRDHPILSFPLTREDAFHSLSIS